MLTELKRDEYHPAYLYHKAPFADAKDLPDEMKPYQTDPRLLKGLKHVLRDQAVSLTGDRSRFDIPMGTEFVLYGKTDKDLQGGEDSSEAGQVPGHRGRGERPRDDHPADRGRERHSLRVHRRQEDARHAADGVRDLPARHRRRDQQAADPDRRRGRPPAERGRGRRCDPQASGSTTYLCTPQALIPFTKESKVRDDKGLNRVDYVFSYFEVEPMAVTLKRLEYAMWFFNSTPVASPLGDLTLSLADDRHLQETARVGEAEPGDDRQEQCRCRPSPRNTRSGRWR